jgi:hypothetical protein
MIFIGTDFCSLVETCKIKPVIMQSTDHQSVYINCIPEISEKVEVIGKSMIQYYRK